MSENNIVPLHDRGWETALLKSSTGSRKNCVFNLALALRQSPAVRGRIAWDEMRQRPVLLGPTPWRQEFPTDWTDYDTLKFTEWVQGSQAIKNATKDMTDQAIDLVCRENAFHPIRDYLKSLEWDGEERLADAAAHYFGDPSEIAQVFLRQWLIAAVARVMKPGCKADNVLILIGGQGIGKSTALRILAGDQYFTDQMPELGSKDSYQQTVGKWIIELGELASFGRASVAAQKNYFSALTDTYRIQNHKRTTDVPRQCVFAGTTNEDEILTDPTGNRRYHPLHCSSIDLDGLTATRDQLWAEAYARFNRGEQWHLTDPRHKELAKEVQEGCVQSDVWESFIRDWAERQAGEITTAQVMRDCLDLRKQDMNRAAEIRVGRCLQKLGYSKKRYRNGNSREYRYHLPVEWE